MVSLFTQGAIGACRKSAESAESITHDITSIGNMNFAGKNHSHHFIRTSAGDRTRSGFVLHERE